MPATVYKRKPNTCDAYRVELRWDVLTEILQWCKGSLAISYDGDQLDGSQTYITIAGNAQAAFEGDYIVKYWDNIDGEEEPTYHIVRGDKFEADYERA